MRQNVLTVIKRSRNAFVRGLVGEDPVAMFRWNTVRTVFAAMNAFKEAKKLMKTAGWSLKFFILYPPGWQKIRINCHIICATFSKFSVWCETFQKVWITC